jgi:hypothetical protein
MTDEEAAPSFSLDVSIKGDVAELSIRMSTDEYKSLVQALSRKETMNALCAAARRTGLDKAMPGSIYCTTCYRTGGPAAGISSVHEHRAKNGFSAWVESFTYCGISSFQMYRGRCRTDGVRVTYHD